MYFGLRAIFAQSPWDEILEHTSSIFTILGADPDQILALSRVKKPDNLINPDTAYGGTGIGEICMRSDGYSDPTYF